MKKRKRNALMAIKKFQPTIVISGFLPDKLNDKHNITSGRQLTGASKILTELSSKKGANHVTSSNR